MVSQSCNRLVFLDGLRGVFSLYVLLCHTYQSQVNVGAKAGVLGAIANTLLYGHLAVDGFIVLSGFCLGLQVSDGKPLNLAQFLQRRYRRILPTYWAALALAILLMKLRLWLQGSELFLNQEKVLVNLLLLNDFFPERSLSGPFWSVAIEWKIYFLFPLFVWLYQRYGVIALLWMSVFCGLVSATIDYAIAPSTNLTNVCPWYGGLFIFGFLASQCRLYYQVSKVALGMVLSVGTVLSVLLIAYPFGKIDGLEPWQFAYHALEIDLTTGLLIASFLLLIASKDGIPDLKDLLSSPVLVRVGTFSYSLYLTHVPMLQTINLVLKRLGIHDPWLMVGVDVFSAITVGFLFCQIFERPFLNNRSERFWSFSTLPERPERFEL